MGNFSCRLVNDNKTIEIVLSNHFSPEDHDEMFNMVQERVNKGVIYCDVNLTQMATINSYAIGMLVTLNAVLLSRNGNLRVILPSRSKVASLLHLAQLNKILRFVYV
ncbi:hypothetical protein LLG95_14295 [bacterium]|nr:hypothetical protein [bacterium]